VGDIYKVLLAKERARAAIEQYIRDSGKIVRRKYAFPVQESVSIDTKFITDVKPFTAGTSTGALSAAWPGVGNVVRTRRTVRRVWFSGAFTYHLPLNDNLSGLMSDNAVRERGLISLDLTPETLWNIAPWSWAVDWFAPVGDYISNLQDWSQDGLVLRWGYLMEHVKCTDTFTWDGPGPSPGILTLCTESKTRIRANPFGFGINWSELSPRQLSIAAALGITHGSR
jgi:hypothetical protein